MSLDEPDPEAFARSLDPDDPPTLATMESAPPLEDRADLDSSSPNPPGRKDRSSASFWGIGTEATKNLPKLTVQSGPIGAADLDLGEVLGRGGMGLVRRAMQVALRREVAVKTIRPGSTSDDVYALVREAVIIGSLEHPSIIPIHILGQSDDGMPILVMKRVEGVSWKELLHDPAHPHWEKVKGDRLAWHLDVLIQVSNAIHFAHSRRIVHLDLKPSNVMIGSFGEVYVLDWGVAFSLKRLAADGPSGDEKKPGRTSAGTPSYMAPEMTTGDPAQISERTDVYLLGTLLHEVLTGKARHQGPTLPQVILSAIESRPYSYESTVPRELAAIANRAMHVNSNERFPSADAFRQALVAFLEHRSSIQISDEALRRLESMKEMLSEPTSSRQPSRPIPVRIYKIFGECRFGFAQALKLWPENAEALRGLQGSIERMAEYELDQANEKAAEALIAELPEARLELAAKLSELRERKKAEAVEIEKLRRIEHDIDLNVGWRTRAFAAIAVALVFNAAPPIYFGVLQGEALTLQQRVVVGIVFVSSIIAGILVGGRTLFQNEANRRLAAACLVAAIGLTLHRAIALILETPVDHVLVNDLLLLTLVSAIVMVTMDRRLVWPGLIFGAALAVSTWKPSWVNAAHLAAGLSAMLALAIVWRPRE